MDKITKYRNIVQELLTKIGSYKNHFPEIETQLIFDTTRDHYQILKTGWRDLERTYGVAFNPNFVVFDVNMNHNAVSAF